MCVLGRLYTRFLLMAALLYATGSIACAQQEAKPTGEATYTWTYQYKKGQVFRMREHTTISTNLSVGIGIGVETTILYRHDVQKVAPNGDATIVRTLESIEGSLQGLGKLESSFDTEEKVVMLVSRNGLVLRSAYSDNAEDAADPKDSTYVRMWAVRDTLPAPPAPVKVGESWKTEVKDPHRPDRKVTLTSTLTGTEKVGGTDTLAVKIEAAIPQRAHSRDKPPIQYECTYNIVPQTGSILRIKTTVENMEEKDPDDTTDISTNITVEIESNLLRNTKPVPPKKPSKKKSA